VVTAPTRIDSLLEASAALVILELSERMLPTDPLTLAIWPSIASHIHRFFSKGCFKINIIIQPE
jgi:hypothetical protein